MRLLPDIKYKYKKENGIAYNIINYLRLNYPIIIIFVLCFLMIYGFSKNKTAVIVTSIFISLNTYFLHRYSDELFGEYNLHKYHHDPKTANLWWAKILEFVVNTTIYGGAIYLLLFNYIFKKTIFDPYTMIFFSIIYTSIHVYSYHVYDIPSHKYHHKDTQYNFGPDVMDIFYETKHQEDDIENSNYFIPNILIATFIVFLLYYNTGLIKF